MSRARMKTPVALLLTASLALLLGFSVAQASATTFGGLGRIGELSIKTGFAKGDVELGENDGFVVEPATGDFYVLDQVEEPQELTRVQKFNPEGKSLAQAQIKLPNGHEVEPRALALDAQKHKLYVLIDGERSSTSKHDGNDVVAAAIVSVSTEANGEELEYSTLADATTLEPYSEKAKVSLIEPAGITVDPTTHDILISAQQDEDLSESEELHSAIQRVHENGALGPRYVDSNNCLDEAAPVAEEPNCEELQGEQPNSLVVTQGGHALVEMELSQLWEIPDSANAASGFKEEKVLPRLLFSLPSGVAQFSGEEGQTGALAYATTAGEEGRLYAAGEVSPNGEPETYGVILLKTVEHSGGQPAISEIGWTGGENSTSKQPKCQVPFAAAMPLEVGGTPEQVDVFSGDETEEGEKRDIEPFLEKFGSSTSAEACGRVELTTPTIKIGSNENVQEATVGKAATLSSKVEGADALATSWKIVRRGAGGNVESEETLASPEYLGKATSLPYTFAHVGEYEITETATTDNLGTPTKQAVRKVKATLPAITFKIEASSALPAEGLPAGTSVALHAKLADPNETEPHLTLTWRFSDGSSPETQHAVGKEGLYTAVIEHAFASTCGGVCAVTLEAKDEKGAEGRDELKILMSKKAEEEAAAKKKAEEEAAAKKKAEEEEAAARKKEEEEAARQKVLGESVTHNPEAKIAGSTSLSVSSNGALTLKVSCPPKETECVGTATLQVVIAKIAKKGKKPKKVTVTLARGSFSVAGGASKSLTLHLSSQGLALLAHGHTLHASLVLLAHDSANVTRKTTTSLTLRLAPKTGKKKH